MLKDLFCEFDISPLDISILTWTIYLKALWGTPDYTNIYFGTPMVLKS